MINMGGNGQKVHKSTFLDTIAKAKQAFAKYLFLD